MPRRTARHTVLCGGIERIFAIENRVTISMGETLC